MIDVLAILSGALVGIAIWWWWIKPSQDRKWERRRRTVGLPPRRKLPEDKSQEEG